MVSDAESHVAEDRAKREVIDLRNQADQLAYQTEKQLVEYKDKISSEDETELRRSLEDLKEAAKQDDKERIRAAIDKHNEVWQRVAQKMYQSASSQPGQAPRRGARSAAGAAAREERRTARSSTPNTRFSTTTRRRSKPSVGRARWNSMLRSAIGARSEIFVARTRFVL